MGVSSLLDAAFYHMGALESTFLAALARGKRAPGLAGFRVIPQHVHAVCSGSTDCDPGLALAKSSYYALHMKALYQIYSTAMAHGDHATLRFINEFKVDATALLLSACGVGGGSGNSPRSSSSSSSSGGGGDSGATNSSHMSSASSSSSSDADDDDRASEEILLALCLDDYSSVKSLVANDIVSASSALEALLDRESFQAAADLYATFGNRISVTTDELLGISEAAAMSGLPGPAWTFIEAWQPDGGEQMVLAAVKADQLVCLTAQPLRAFTLIWSTSHFAEAVNVYHEFNLQQRLSMEDKAALLVRVASAGASGAADVIVSLFQNERDAGLALLIDVVRCEKADVVLCLLEANNNSSSSNTNDGLSRAVMMLKRIVQFEAKPSMKQLLQGTA